MRLCSFPICLLAFWLTVTTITSVRSEDHLLVIAGGYSAASNQVSLEKNMRFFREVVEDVALGTPTTELYSSGNADIRSVQFETGNESVPKANEYMARLFGSTRNLKLQYRQHELGTVDGTTSPANLKRWFDEDGKKLKSGDRLILYATCHGGRSRNKKEPSNTTLLMWERQSVTVTQLQDYLRDLPDGVEVVFVMAQCYAGGFAHAIFEKLDPDKGVFDRPVSGFFATVSSREAAGCTADINEENYDEFSSHFWAAIRGTTRLGEPAGDCDYDENGIVSFDEAFAYTVLSSRNIDLPIKTTCVFLRAKSRYGDPGKDADLWLQHTDYSKVIECASPTERAILEGLSERLELTGENRYAEAEKRAKEIEEKRAELQNELNAKKRVSDGHRNAIRNSLYNRWPEISNLFTEQSAKLLTTEADAFVSQVESHPRFDPWNAVQNERETISQERFKLEKEWVQFVRFQRAHNNVVLAQNLAKAGSLADREAFEELKRSERAGIGAVGTESSRTSR